MKVQKLLFVLAAVLITMTIAAPLAIYPCTGLTRYVPYAIDPHRYILCDDIYGPLILFCPDSYIWNQGLQTCEMNDGISIVTTTQPLVVIGTVISTGYAAPCTQENILLNKMFFAYPYDQTKYIQCDRLGDAYLKSCPQGFHFLAEYSNCV